MKLGTFQWHKWINKLVYLLSVICYIYLYNKLRALGFRRENSKRFSENKFYQIFSMVFQRDRGIAESTPATELMPFWRKVKNSGFMTAMRTSLRPYAKLPMKNYLTKSGGIMVMFCNASSRKVEQSVRTCVPPDMTKSLLKIIKLFSIEFCLKALFD